MFAAAECEDALGRLRVKHPGQIVWKEVRFGDGHNLGCKTVKEVAQRDATKSSHGRSAEFSRRMVFIRSIGEHVIQFLSMFQPQIPFKNLYLYAAIIPGKLQVCLKVRRIFPDQIFASYLLFMKGAVTAARVPEQNWSIGTDQPQGGVVAPPGPVHNDHLKQGLARVVCNGFQVEPSMIPIGWSIRGRAMSTSDKETDK